MRIVSLVPSLTEALFQLGVGAQVVGRTRFCIEPEGQVGGIEAVGGTKDPDVARIGALEPDLIVTNRDENKPEHVEGFRDRGLNVLHTDTDDLDRVETTWQALGRAVDREDAAGGHVAAIRAARNNAVERSPDAPLGVVVPVWRRPLVCMGPGTYMEDLFAACGFRNLVGGDTKWPTLERIDQFGAPQVVLLPTEPYRWREEHRGSWEQDGIAREQVRVVDGQLATWFCSRTAPALDHFSALAAGLYAEAEKGREDTSGGNRRR